MRNRFTAGLLATTLGAGLLTVGAPGAHAGSKGRKNTAIGLGALAAYGLLRGKTGTGLLAGAGAAYAYKRYKDARNDERRYGRYSTRSRSRYRTTAADGGFRFPDNYNPNDGYRNDRYQYQDDYYQNDRYQYQNGSYGGQYQRGKGSSYTTDEWGNRHYYNPRYGDGQNRYGDEGRRYRRAGYRSRYSSDDRPPGWSRGRKTGWYRNGRR
jgi:hypothetical protein